jgi:GntR family transcriptional regulator
MSKVNPRALSQAVTHNLLEEIRVGKYKDAKRLPPEDELSFEFGASRSMMRECLTELERIGILNRHKGIGTLINRRIVDIPTRLDIIKGLDSLLVELGYTITSPYLNVHEGMADEEVARNLEIPVNSPVLIYERVVATNDKPSLYLCDYVPISLLPEKKYIPKRMIPSIFQFLKQEAGIETNMFLTEIRAVVFLKKLRSNLTWKTNTPVLSCAKQALIL